MKIIIDGKPNDLPVEGLGMEGVLQAIFKTCADDRRVAVAVTMDGQHLPDFEGPSVQAIDPVEVDTLEVETEDIDQVAVNILKSSAESIPQLIDEFSLINQDIQSREVESGLRRTEKAVTFWISIVEGCLKAIIILNKDLDTIRVPVSGPSGEQPFSGNEVLQKINSLLEETQSAFENQDNLEIGDIFEYDLPPLLRAFQQVLFRVAQPE